MDLYTHPIHTQTQRNTNKCFILSWLDLNWCHAVQFLHHSINVIRKIFVFPFFCVCFLPLISIWKKWSIYICLLHIGITIQASSSKSSEQTICVFKTFLMMLKSNKSILFWVCGIMIMCGLWKIHEKLKERKEIESGFKEITLARTYTQTHIQFEARFTGRANFSRSTTRKSVLETLSGISSRL